MKKLVLVFAIFVSLTSIAQSKIGHVNTQKLLDTLPSRKAAMIQIQDFEKRGMEELKEMETELQKKYSKYMSEQASLTPVLKQYEEEQLQKKQQAMQQREQELQQKMQQLGNELNEPILKRVKKAIEIIAGRKKLNYVVDETSTLYFAGGSDITNEVMNELLKLDTIEAPLKK
jgi:outer membrane protein